MNNNTKLRIVKLITIFVLGNLYLFLGVVTSTTMNKYIAKPYDTEKSKFRNFIQLTIEVGLIVIAVYCIRVIVKSKIPNPFHGMYGFDSRRVRELNGNIVLAFAFLMYLQVPIKSKVQKLYNFYNDSHIFSHSSY